MAIKIFKDNFWAFVLRKVCKKQLLKTRKKYFCSTRACEFARSEKTLVEYWHKFIWRSIHIPKHSFITWVSNLQQIVCHSKANLHGKKYKWCLSFMWKASEVRDDQIIVPMLYLALWQVKLLLGFDETKYTVIHQKHSN